MSAAAARASFCRARRRHRLPSNHHGRGFVRPERFDYYENRRSTVRPKVFEIIFVSYSRNERTENVSVKLIYEHVRLPRYTTPVMGEAKQRRNATRNSPAAVTYSPVPNFAPARR